VHKYFLRIQKLGMRCSLGTDGNRKRIRNSFRPCRRPWEDRWA